MEMRIINAKRVVIKVGTNVLTLKGNISEDCIKNLVSQIVKLKKSGIEVLLVTSGAIGFGMSELKLKKRPRDIRMLQACAAIGQSILMSKYTKFFGNYNQKVAQILLTYEAFSTRKTYLNLRNSIATLLKLGVIPIINENDPISIDEIGPSFGDNDKLSALVASKVEADLLLILTTVDGLYDKDPKRHKEARLIKEVDKITNEIIEFAGKSFFLGLGGMKSKVLAAKLATEAGTTVIIANGKIKDVITRVLKGEELGTIFLPGKKISNKKRWIAYSKPKGIIMVDKGAMEAILRGKNLLPAGVIKVVGNFNMGEVVELKYKNKVFAKAITDYSAQKLIKVKGKNSTEIRKLYKRINVTRRENLVILE